MNVYHRLLFHLSLVTISLLLIPACADDSAKSSITLSLQADSILRDTTHVGYVVDSLRRKYFESVSDSQRIDVINDLGQHHRACAWVLCEEALTQSRAVGYEYGEADALCRKGIIYYRRSAFDTARVFYEQSKSLAEKIHSDKLKAQAIGWIGDSYRMEGETDKAMQNLEEARRIAEACDAKSVSAFCLSAMGSMYYTNGDYDKSIDFTNRALWMAAETNDKFRMGFCLSSLGKVYVMKGNFAGAISSYSSALSLAKQVENKTLISFCLNSMGDLYRQQSDTAQAKKCFLEALAMAIEIGDKTRHMYALAYLGDIARMEKKYDVARDYYRQALPISELTGKNTDVSYVLNGIGESYLEQGIPDSSIWYSNLSISKCNPEDDDEQITNDKINLSRAYYVKGEYNQALSYGEDALQGAKILGIPEYEHRVSDILYRVYKIKGDSKKALEMHEYNVTIRDSLVNVDNVKKFEEEEYKAKENELRSQQLEQNAKAEQEKLERENDLEKQTYISYFVAGGGLLALICLVIAIRGYRNKRRANEAIQLQKEQVEQQKTIIEEKNKEIVDSINYAQRIQTALFPAEKLVKDVFGDCFILYLPKDIVSGDFYWMEKAKDGSALIAAVDCTGHGVPGALVSVVANNALNRTVREFGLSEPGKILDKLNDLVTETFAQSESDVKDGMDISLMNITSHSGNKQIRWAGANNNLWYVRNGVLSELKADRQPIAKQEKQVNFTTHTLDIIPGDFIYLFTDGFADQFGGEKGKKFKAKPLQELLVKIAAKPAEEQKSILVETFNAWKGNLEQVDDVLIIGIKG